MAEYPQINVQITRIDEPSGAEWHALIVAEKDGETIWRTSTWYNSPHFLADGIQTIVKRHLGDAS